MIALSFLPLARDQAIRRSGSVIINNIVTLKRFDDYTGPGGSTQRFHHIRSKKVPDLKGVKCRNVFDGTE